GVALDDLALAAAAAPRLDVRHVDDPGLPRRRCRELERPGGLVLGARMGAAGRHAGRPEPRDVGARQAPRLGPDPLPDGQHLAAAVAAAQGVRLLAGAVQEAISGAALVGRAVLPAQAAAAEHEAQLLLGAVRVRRRGVAAGLDLLASDADRDRPRG